MIKRPNVGKPGVFISVIVPVRNEEPGILIFLRGLEKQSYSKSLFEIIIVDDHSEDKTFRLAGSFKSEHNDLNISLIKLKDTSSKKAALTAGIKIAKGKIIVTTDADCTFQELWLEALAGCYEQDHPEMIIAPVLVNADNTFFQRFQQYDYMAMQMMGLASAELGLPILCSGANLAFTKEAFMSVNGYEGNENIASGDDVFLCLKIKKQYPRGIKALIDSNAIVRTLPQHSVIDFINQRQRWSGKVRYYKNSYISFIGGIIFIVNLILFFTGIVAFKSQEWLQVFAGLFFIKVIVEFVFLKTGAMFFSTRIRVLAFLFSELIYPFYLLFLIVKSILTKAEWKGRTLKT